MSKYTFFINGKWVEAEHEDVIEVENPATLEVLAEVPAGHEEAVNAAVKAAKDALPQWKEMPVEERIELVGKMVDYMEANGDEIAKTISLELGVPLKYARKRHLDGYLAAARDWMKMAEEFEFVDRQDGYEVHKEPVGVVACLTPWNYPYGQIANKVFPALLLGNTVVIKPSQQTPLTSYVYAHAAEAAGLPAGVLNLVPGRGGEVGNLLATHPDVNLVSFTGSTKGGIEVSKLALDSVKRLTLELGGKSATILLEDGDISAAVKSTLDTVYLNVGQTCSATTRLLAPRKLKDEVEAELIKQTKEYTFGDPLAEESIAGPLASKKQYDKVRKYIDLGKSEAELLYEGETPEGEGYFVGPVIFTEVDPKARIAQEEIFGPVLSIIYYDKEEEALQIANDSIYGLAGKIFGEEERARKLAKHFETGMIQINDTGRRGNAPFGGFKQSGFGREGGYYGLEEFIELKALIV